jgi:hypothetical protein
MASCASHHLESSGIEHFLADGMGKLRVLRMTGGADRIDRSLGHIRIIGAMGHMAVGAGICRLVFVLACIVPLESIQVTGAANEALPPLEQPLVIAGMGGVAGSAAIFPESHQMVV